VISLLSASVLSAS